MRKGPLRMSSKHHSNSPVAFLSASFIRATRQLTRKIYKLKSAAPWYQPEANQNPPLLHAP